MKELELKLEAIIKSLDYELEYTEYVNEFNQNIYRVVIDKQDKCISTEDCEYISRKIEETVDNNFKGEYMLEVSSAGLERKIKNLKLYKKYINRDIRVKLYKSTNILSDLKLKEFDAKLLEVVNDDKVKLSIKVNNIDIKFDMNIKDIASANTIYNFGEEK